MAKRKYGTIMAWLKSNGDNEDDFAPRHINIQLSEDGDQVVAIASVGEEDYLAGDTMAALDDALEALDNALASEGGRLMSGESHDDKAQGD